MCAPAQMNETTFRFAAAGGFALVTVSCHGFEVSGITTDEKVAREWVAVQPECRRYADVPIFTKGGAAREPRKS